MNIKSNKLTKNTIMLYIMTIGKYLLPLITLPYLTRILTPKFYGVVTYMTSTMTYFQVLIDFGFLYSSTRDISKNRENKTFIGKTLSSTIFAKVLLGILGFLILIFLSFFIEIIRNYLLIAILYYISVLTTIFIPDFVYRGLEKMEIVSLRFIISRIISTILTFILIKDSSDLYLIPILNMVGNLAAVLFSMIHLKKIEKIRFEKIQFNDILISIKNSSVFFIATFATTAFGATTTILMGAENVSTEDIAYWNLAYQIITTIQMLYDPIISSVYPHMVKEKDYSIIKKILSIFMPIVLVGFVFSIFMAKYAIIIMGGKDYLDAVLILKILLPILVFSFPSQILGFPVLAPLGKEKFATLSTIIASVFHIFGLIFLIIIGKFTILYIAILRCCTDLILLISRIIIWFIMKKMVYCK